MWVRPQWAPPVTKSTSPVIHPLRGEARKSTACAMSSATAGAAERGRREHVADVGVRDRLALPGHGVHHQAGRHRVDADAVGAQLRGEHLGEHVDRRLRAAVVRSPGARRGGGPRRDVHDPAGGAAPDHLAPDRLAAEHGALHVDGEDAVPLLLADLEHGAHRHVAREVDQHVDRAEPAPALGERRLDVGPARDVARAARRPSRRARGPGAPSPRGRAPPRSVSRSRAPSAANASAHGRPSRPPAPVSMTTSFANSMRILQ